jgi:hypothetical protein
MRAIYVRVEMNRTYSTMDWIGSDLTKAGNHYHIVDTELVARLAHGLPTEFQVPETVKAEDQFLVQVRDILSDIATVILEKTQSNLGLAILTGSGLEELTDDQLSAMLYGLSLILGQPMVQNLAGERLVLIRDEHPTDSQNARGYVTKDKMLLHTDASDLVGFICHSQAASGGANLFASATAVHDILTDEAPEMLHQYYRLWNWNVSGLQISKTPPTVLSPIFSFYAGELSCRYGSSMLRKGASGVGERLTIEQVKALDLFEEMVQRSKIVLRYTLRRGESVWINNYRVLHGREAFEDDSSIAQMRRLLRVWTWLDNRPVLAPTFASFDHHIFGHDRTKRLNISVKRGLDT